MDSFNNNPRTPKKKLVDLKAVAALLDEDTENNVTTLPKSPSHPSFVPNEDLIQETTRIKSQRDLIIQRMEKMDSNRDKVTKNVYEKVARDYAMQLNAINELLAEKKNHLQREMKNLYTVKEKQIVDTNRHREILEEAKFRHYLGEFTEDQFKEVEEYESREITRLQGEMARLNSIIKIHEELFDPQELGLSPAPKAAPAPDFSPPTQSIPKFSAQKMAESMAAPSAPAFPEPTRTLVPEPTVAATLQPPAPVLPPPPSVPTPVAVQAAAPTIPAPIAQAPVIQAPIAPPPPPLPPIEELKLPEVPEHAPIKATAFPPSQTQIPPPPAAVIPTATEGTDPAVKTVPPTPTLSGHDLPPHPDELGLTPILPETPKAATTPPAAPQAAIQPPQATAQPQSTEEKTGHYQLDSEANYFQDLSEPSMRVPPPPEGLAAEMSTPEGSVIVSKKEAETSYSSTVIKQVAAEINPPKKEASEDPLLDILDDIPFEDSVSETKNKSMMDSASDITPQPGMGTAETVARATAPSSGLSIGGAASGSYKMIFVEGETQASDLVLQDNVSIGRSPSNDLVLNAPKVSRQHAAINKYKDKYILIDLKSSNGVYVNGKKIEEHPLEDGDEVSIAGYRFLFKKI